MNNPAMQRDLTLLQKVGLIIFVFLCGIPGMEMNGFGVGIPLTLPVALACATIGGAVGGMLICSRPLVAGLIGGLFAGPFGLLAVYFYTQNRESVWNLELVIVQGLACLPGIGIGWLIKTALAALTTESPQPTPPLAAHPLSDLNSASHPGNDSRLA